jgi:pyruvate dehydrogenase E1 component
LGGFIPGRLNKAAPLDVPDLSIFAKMLESTGEKEMSTTMAFVRMITALARDKKIGRNIVPIVPDEARTFGMEGLFRQLGIYSSVGQLYTPQDQDQVMFYKEDKAGQILEEGINEAGAMSSWIAAATAYSTTGVNMIPFYIYYSMFGFQRVGDLAWAAGDMQAKGFLVGGTAGRTTLAGEGLQHQDGHSLLQAATIPNCHAYDPTFAYEMAVVIQHGMKRMYVDQDNVFYYITAMNENYSHPGMPEGAEEGIIKGLYLFRKGNHKKKLRVNLMGSGSIFREVIAAAELLENDFKVSADIWGVTSFNELRRDALDCERWNMLHPEVQGKVPYISKALDNHHEPYIAATDYIRSYPDQVRQWIPGSYTVLGTDGYGRSDTRAALRRHFEVDRYYVAVAALKALADQDKISADTVTQAMDKYKINADRSNPIDL